MFDNIASKQRTMIILLWVLAGIAIFCLYNPAQLFFLNDDFIYISKSPELNYVYRTSFRPISDITLLADYNLYYQSATGYHLTNLLFHAICIWLLYKFSKQCIAFFKLETTPLLPHFAAIFFMVYAFHSESVYWIIGRGGSLVTASFLAALILFMQPSIKTGQFVLALFFFIVALFTYESSWMLPAVLTIICYFKWKIYGSNIKHLVLISAPFWISLTLFFVSRKLMLNDYIASPYYNPTEGYGISVKQMIYNYATGLTRSFVPPGSTGFFVAATAITGLVLAVVICFLYIKRKAICWHLYAFLTTGFILTLSPVVLLGVSTHTSETERILYLPSAFLCVLIIAAIFDLLKQHISLRNAVVAGLLLMHLFFLQNTSIAYKSAGAANKFIINEMEKVEGSFNNLHVINLPERYKAGFMFALGFEEAIGWYCPRMLYKNMRVYSRTEYLTPPNFVRLNAPTSNMQHLIKSYKIPMQPGDLLVVWDQNNFYIEKE